MMPIEQRCPKCHKTFIGTDCIGRECIECELTALQSENPYLEKIVVVRRYNPNYGDDRICRCGHSYGRHFDPYEGMEPVGCKYCGCYEFVEQGKSNYQESDDLC